MHPSPVRPAAVAGLFYPAAAQALQRTVDGLLAAAGSRPPAPCTPPKALIAPHAGYVYSGAVAASAYARVAPLRGTVTRVVLIGPCHRVAVRGIAVPSAQAFDTPLGRIEIDQDAIARLRRLPAVVDSDAAHERDHALEVHLPFLQRTLGRFTLVPLLVGDAAPAQVAAVLEQLWGGRETLIVISSDLSHYLPYETARREDSRTVDEVLSLDGRVDHHHACGATAVNGLVEIARRKGLQPELLDLRNSGDTAGDRTQVVGYASIAFTDPADARARPRDNSEQSGEGAQGGAVQGDLLLGVARSAIAMQLGLEVPVRENAAFLRAAGASFVTLRRDGELRGCIGTLVAHRPLLDDVRHNACAAAFDDPRFPPLRVREFDSTRVEVSLLDTPVPLAFDGEDDLLAQLRPLADGLILEFGARRATFLPQVWEALPSAREFLAQLKAKAGLARDFWSDELRISRYAVRKWAES
jgi:AmmeMemoRadiSam system protein B/AmmeMemoRadiSam system protein A